MRRSHASRPRGMSRRRRLWRRRERFRGLNETGRGRHRLCLPGLSTHRGIRQTRIKLSNRRNSKRLCLRYSILRTLEGIGVVDDLGPRVVGKRLPLAAPPHLLLAYLLDVGRFLAEGNMQAIPQGGDLFVLGRSQVGHGGGEVALGGQEGGIVGEQVGQSSSYLKNNIIEKKSWNCNTSVLEKKVD